MRKPAVFLDRDGLLVQLVRDAESDAPSSPLTVDEFALFRHAPAFVRALNDRGYLVIVVTDQPAMARGRLSPIGLARIHGRLRDEIAAGGGRIDGIYHCPHDPDEQRSQALVVGPAVGCRCRKPAPGLILHAAQRHHVDLHRSFMVCRDLCDVKAGRSAALETVLLTRSRMREIEAPPDLRPHHVVPALVDVLRILDAARAASEAR